MLKYSTYVIYDLDKALTSKSCKALNRNVENAIITLDDMFKCVRESLNPEEAWVCGSVSTLLELVRSISETDYNDERFEEMQNTVCHCKDMLVRYLYNV